MIYDTHNFSYEWACNYFAVFPVSWDNYIYEDPVDMVTAAGRSRPKNSDNCWLNGKSRKEMWDGKKYMVMKTGWHYY
jgi:hypothetical protein